MVSDSARKKTIRERMSVTGDNYSTAARTIDKQPQVQHGAVTAVGGLDPGRGMADTSATVDFTPRDWVFVTGREGLWKIVSLGSGSAEVCPAGNSDEVDVVPTELLEHHATMHAERTLSDRQREALDNLRQFGAWPDTGWMVKDRTTTRAALRRLVQHEFVIEDRRTSGRFMATPPQGDPPTFIGPLLNGRYPCRHSPTGGSEDGAYGECRLDGIDRGMPRSPGWAPQTESAKASICKQVSSSGRRDELDRLHRITVRSECAIPGCGCGSPPPPPPVEMRLPGRPRPAAEVLDEYNQGRAKFRGGFKPTAPAVLQQFYTDMNYPPAEKLWRWRVQLDCGCVTERLTRGADRAPVAGREEDIYTGEKLLPGQLVCAKHKDPKPYRTVLEYISWEEMTLPASTGADELPAALRRDEPETKASWKVRLCCGHIGTQLTELSWRPGDGFPGQAGFDTPHKRADAHGRFEEARGDIDPQELEHWHRMIDLGWPEPAPEDACQACSWAKTIVAYERVGPLVRPPRTATPRKGPAKSTLTRRLREVEAEAARLREQLDDLQKGDRGRTSAASIRDE